MILEKSKAVAPVAPYPPNKTGFSKGSKNAPYLRKIKIVTLYSCVGLYTDAILIKRNYFCFGMMKMKPIRLKNKSKPKPKYNLPGRATTPQEIQALLRACGKGSAGIRNAAFISICAGAGLRCSEALSLKPSHYEKTRDGSSITVISGKGGKSRKVALMPEFECFIDRWLDKRKGLGINGRCPLICGITNSQQKNTFGGDRGTLGKPVSSALMRATIIRLGKKAKIETRVHVHGLRHGMATAWAKAGIELRAISQQLGHCSTATTDKYLAKLCPKMLLAAAATVKMLSLA